MSLRPIVPGRVRSRGGDGARRLWSESPVRRPDMRRVPNLRGGCLFYDIPQPDTNQGKPKIAAAAGSVISVQVDATTPTLWLWVQSYQSDGYQEAYEATFDADWWTIPPLPADPPVPYLVSVAATVDNPDTVFPWVRMPRIRIRVC